MLGGKSSGKQPVKCVQVVTASLLFFVIGEFFLQKQLAVDRTTCSRETLPREDDMRPLVMATSPTVHEAFRSDIAVVHWENLTARAPPLRTSIDRSDSNGYGMSPVRNICVRPNGTIVVVGTGEMEFFAGAGEAMVREWRETYACAWGCSGAAFEAGTPADALWLPGTTTHIVPYLGNVFHHFAERVWPLLTEKPTDYYYVHRMHTWLEQAHHNMDRNTFMFQIALLARRSKFLQHGEHEARPLCFERLLLSSAASGRMSAQLGLTTFAPAMARYRDAAFSYFNITPPAVALPPRPLRVTLYGRSDASRRRVTNLAAVARELRTSTELPPLVVTAVDELMARGEYNQSLPEVVSLMAQTDVYITPHGANTWATLFMPARSAVIEILGPCGPGTWIANTIVPALKLKHRTEGNPWREKAASPRAGNTTECRSALETPDFAIDLAKLHQEIQSLRAVDGPGDSLALHWLFDWHRNSY